MNGLFLVRSNLSDMHVFMQRQYGTTLDEHEWRAQSNTSALQSNLQDAYMDAKDYVTSPRLKGKYIYITIYVKAGTLNASLVHE